MPLVARLGPLWPVAVVIGLGVLAALGQAPWSLWYLAVPALAGVMWLVAGAAHPRAAFWRGWWAGAAQFAVALNWIVDPFLVAPERDGWMAPFALVFMAGGLALFWGLAGWLAVAATRNTVARLWAFALAMLGFEALRGYLFTGFPWALTGHIWIGTPVDQLAALGGALLLSAWALGLGAALATAGARALGGRRWRGAAVLAAAGVALGLAWGWGVARLAEPAPEAPGVPLRLVQGDVPQDQKWQPELIEGFFRRHLDLTRLSSEVAPALVIWPESAVPFLLESAGGALEAIGQAAGVPVVFGVDRRVRDAEGARHYYNALAVIDPQGEITAVYDKYHLVPFGEYMPLLGLFADRFGGLAARALSGYTPGPGPVVLDLGPAGRVLPLICYEAVFARSLWTAVRPDWILQITNDAWFGTRSGPYQHLAQARLRAIEAGLPLVRAANTGVSAVIDARGRIEASLDLGVMGVLDAPLPGARAITPYARVGDAPWNVGLALALAWLGWRGWQRTRLRRKAIDLGRR